MSIYLYLQPKLDLNFESGNAVFFRQGLTIILLYIRPMYVEVNWSIDNKETIIAVIFLLVTYYID